MRILVFKSSFTLTNLNRVESVLNYQNKGFVVTVGIFVSLLIAYLTASVGVLVPLLSIAIGVISIFLIIVFQNPLYGLISTLIYCFCFALVERELGGFPFGYVVELLYVVVTLAAILKTSSKDWKRAQNDLLLLFSLWFLVSVLQLLNPSGASFDGWLSEIRTSGFDSFMLILLGFLIFKTVRHLDIFLFIIIACSLLATLNGMKQLHIGLFAGEQQFLDANPTHMIWGQLRVFSFYRDAGQFGASQACFVVICGVLAFGPFKLWKRIVFSFLTLFFFYGMLISGTRGAFFALVPGIFLAVFLFKNIRVLLSGTLFLASFIAVLKYTYIGSGFSYVHRLRSALDPTDPSLNLRFLNQQILSDYIKDFPFGGGLGVMGYAGGKYNSNMFLSAIAPDSYWVKVWGMYGIVGFTLWFCMMGYILGKCCGIVWNIKDERLRVKLTALTASFFGVFICSYGNEVINALPTSIVTYLSLVLIYMGPLFDNDLMNRDKQLP